MEFGAIPILGEVQWRCLVLLVIMRLFRLVQLSPQLPNFKLLAWHRNRTLVPRGNILRPLRPNFRLGGERKAERLDTFKAVSSALVEEPLLGLNRSG